MLRTAVYYAIVFRSAMLVFQFVVNYMFEDFDSSTHVKFQLNQDGSVIHTQNDSFLGSNIFSWPSFLDGLNKWDAAYFNHISMHGYTYEQILVFFPGFPYLVSFFSSGISSAIKRKLYIQLFGVLLNFVFYILATVMFYKLTEDIVKRNLHEIDKIDRKREIHVTEKNKRLREINKDKDTDIRKGAINKGRKTKTQSFTFISSLLFTVNPAHIFMMTSYSESMFVCFQFATFLALERGYFWIAVNTLAITTLTRSNGILNILFMAYFFMKMNLRENINLVMNNGGSYILKLLYPNRLLTFISSSFTRLVTLLILLLISILPFIGYQVFVYRSFCKLPHLNFTEHWCQQTIPYSYPYLQREYWNVGFLRYYELKQIPNFLLAFPAVFIIMQGARRVICTKDFAQVLKTLGLYEIDENTKYEKAQNLYNVYDKTSEKSEIHESSVFKFDNERLLTVFSISDVFVYLCHALFLTVFGLFNIHVQVLTRILFSSTPFIYWAATQELVDGNEKFAMFLFCYFIVFNLTGVFLHCNFYPWT